MGCNCGGGRSVYAAATAASGGGWTASAGNDSVWIVTYPDGTTEEFASDSDAYRAIRSTGGGIRQKPR